MWINVKELALALEGYPWAKDMYGKPEEWEEFIKWLESHVLYDFLERITRQVDEIVEIDPDLSERRILEQATRYMVEFLGAESASVRIYDPQSQQMLSYGSYPSKEEKREPFIPLGGTIAGEVVKTRKTIVVPDILSDSRYRNKTIVLREGISSLMAIPLEIPRFFPHERDTVGVIQIYYAEKNRSFTRLEIQIAELLAKRLALAMARKKILSMHKINEKKDAIVHHIFKSLGNRGGIKMEEVFNKVIPELADMVNVQSCALFSVASDYKYVVLEAGYPQKEGYHSIGKSFEVSSEPAFEVLLGLADYKGDGLYELVTPHYILVVDPQRSEIISEHMKKFARQHNINSILYIPLHVEGEITYFMTFDALEHRQRYQDDEIEIFMFLGRELMKAQRMERLDDILHDFKNPAIAIAGFARRLKRLLEHENLSEYMPKIKRYVDILFEETSRMQELALSIYEVGSEQVVDMTEVLRRRFEINKEAIKEQFKQNVILEEGPFEKGLLVCCYRIHLERVFDNLLNNATKAIPLKGGRLSIRTFRQKDWACAEIKNTGPISEEDKSKLLEGEGEGRGLYITHRIIRLLNGKIEMDSTQKSTTFVVMLPMHLDKSETCKLA